MIDKEVLLHDLYLLSQSYYKVIEVNLDDGTYFEVKVSDEEPHVYNNIKYWMDEFIAAGGVHTDDVERFKEFFNPFILKQTVVDKWPRVFYNRLIDGEYKMVCMEVIPMDNYSPEDPIVLIIVKEIEDYINDYNDQVIDKIIEKFNAAGYPVVDVNLKTGE